MKDIQKDVFEIIDSKFKSRNFFQYEIDLETEELIKSEIERFEVDHPELISKILKQIRTDHPSATVQNYTHFFNLDRCLRLIIEFTNEIRFICQISIFGYFSIYTAPLITYDGIHYESNLIRFIDVNEMDICNQIYNSIDECIPNLKWLPKSLLEEIVFRLTDLDYLDDSTYDSVYNISVGSVLFTKHYG